MAIFVKKRKSNKISFKPYLGSTTEKASEADTAEELWSLDLFKDIPARENAVKEFIEIPYIIQKLDILSYAILNFVCCECDTTVAIIAYSYSQRKVSSRFCIFFNFYYFVFQLNCHNFCVFK